MNDPQNPYSYQEPGLSSHPSPAPEAPNPAAPLKVLPPPDSLPPAGVQAPTASEENTQGRDVEDGEPSTINPPAAQTDAQSRPKTRRRTGKIARLKKVDRDRLNHMLRDGEPYAAILEKLGESAKGITVQNVSGWKGGGYIDWEKDQEWVEETQAGMEVALDVGGECDARKVNQSVIQIAVLKIFQGLRNLGLDTMDAKRLTDPAIFARVVSALARLSKESLNLQKHGEAAAKAVAAELKHLDPTREFTDREHEIITDRMDDYFLKPRRRKPDAENPSPHSSAIASPPSIASTTEGATAEGKEQDGGKTTIGN